MTLATLLGLLIFSVVSMLIGFGIIGAVAALGEKQPVMPAQAVLRLDMSSVILGEQTAEADPFSMITGGAAAAQIGIYDAVRAINTAASDPAVKFIYMTPDATSGGIAQIEEFRKALQNFRANGKAVISYIENPSNAGYYLASVSDKIYMTPHDGGMNMFNGISIYEITAFPFALKFWSAFLNSSI